MISPEKQVFRYAVVLAAAREVDAALSAALDAMDDDNLIPAPNWTRLMTASRKLSRVLADFD